MKIIWPQKDWILKEDDPTEKDKFEKNLICKGKQKIQFSLDLAHIKLEIQFHHTTWEKGGGQDGSYLEPICKQTFSFIQVEIIVIDYFRLCHSIEINPVNQPKTILATNCSFCDLENLVNFRILWNICIKPYPHACLNRYLFLVFSLISSILVIIHNLNSKILF